MKTASRLQLSLRNRAMTLMLFAVLAAWTLVLLAMVPRDHEPTSAPRGDRMSPSLPYSIPSLPSLSVRV